MPTYAVRCATCGEDRWPTLPDRPDRYVCARCVAVGPATVAERKEAGQRSAATRKARQGKPQDSTGAV